MASHTQSKVGLNHHPAILKVKDVKAIADCVNQDYRYLSVDTQISQDGGLAPIQLTDREIFP